MRTCVCVCRAPYRTLTGRERERKREKEEERERGKERERGGERGKELLVMQIKIHAC